MDNIIWRCSEKLSDDGELVDVILSREQWLALQHLCEDASCTPDINLHIVLLPCEHNLRRSVISRGDISGHLGILNTRETEIADLQVAVLIYENIAGLEISVDDTCRMDIFQATLRYELALPHFLLLRGRTHQDLVQEVLDKLLLERSRSQETVQIGAKELGDEVAVKSSVSSAWKDITAAIHILKGRNENITERDNLQKISIPETGLQMKRIRTFSCFKCFKSFNSRYVLFDRTGVLKGFIIFFTATFWPVS